MKKIAFAGTDGRTLLWAYVTSTATSEIHSETYEGVVVTRHTGHAGHGQPAQLAGRFYPHGQ